MGIDEGRSLFSKIMQLTTSSQMLNSHLLNLLQLTDPTLPIGGYAHSAGLETYVQQGIVKDLISARHFITKMLTQSIQFTDAAFVSLAYDAAAEQMMGILCSS